MLGAAPRVLLTALRQVRYLTSFFEVCFALEPSMAAKFHGYTAQEVGVATAEHCFRRADADGDGFITFEEVTIVPKTSAFADILLLQFKYWYSSDDALSHSTFVPR